MLAYFEACVRHFGDPATRERYLQLYDPAVVLHGYGLAPGIDAVRAHYRALWAGLPDVTLAIDDAFAKDDRLAARFRIRGTHLGPLRGIAPSGRRIEYGGITILRFAGGKCVERWSQTDGLSLMQQLGARLELPPQPAG